MIGQNFFAFAVVIMPYLQFRRGRYNWTKLNRTKHEKERQLYRRRPRNKITVQVPLSGADQDLIDYIYMVYYPEKAKLVRMPAPAPCCTQIAKYEYRFTVPVFHRSGINFASIVHGRPFTGSGMNATRTYAEAITQGKSGGCMWNNLQPAAAENHTLFGSASDTFNNLQEPLGPRPTTTMYYRMLAQKITIVPTSGVDNRMGRIAIGEDCGYMPKVRLSTANIANVLQDPGVSIYPLAGATQFHSTWFPSRPADKLFRPYGNNATDTASLNIISAEGQYNAVCRNAPWLADACDNYWSNYVICEGLGSQELLECVYTVVIEYYDDAKVIGGAAPRGNHEKILAAGGAHHTLRINDTASPGGFHNGSGAPVSHIGAVISHSLL